MHLYLRGSVGDYGIAACGAKPHLAELAHLRAEVTCGKCLDRCTTCRGTGWGRIDRTSNPMQQRCPDCGGSGDGMDDPFHPMHREAFVHAVEAMDQAYDPRCVDCGAPAYSERDGASADEARCWTCAAREVAEFAADHPID